MLGPVFSKARFVAHAGASTRIILAHDLGVRRFSLRASECQATGQLYERARTRRTELVLHFFDKDSFDRSVCSDNFPRRHVQNAATKKRVENEMPPMTVLHLFQKYE